MQNHILPGTVLLQSRISHLPVVFTKRTTRFKVARQYEAERHHAGWDNERFGSATFAGFMELKQSENIGKGKRDRQSRTSEPHQRLLEKAITQIRSFFNFLF